MTPMMVNLREDMADQIKTRLESGRFSSTDELFAEALRLLMERETARDALRREIQIGIDEIERGEGIPADEAWARLKLK
jgi:antitoxin ParD1/3/4